MADSQTAIEHTALQKGAFVASDMLVISVGQAFSEQFIESARAALQTDDLVFRALMEFVGPVALGLALAGATESRHWRNFGLGFVATGAKYGLKTPIQKGVQLLVERDEAVPPDQEPPEKEPPDQEPPEKEPPEKMPPEAEPPVAGADVAGADVAGALPAPTRPAPSGLIGAALDAQQRGRASTYQYA